MNECDQFGRLGDGGDGYRFSFKRNGSRVGWMDAGDNLINEPIYQRLTHE